MLELRDYAKGQNNITWAETISLEKHLIGPGSTNLVSITLGYWDISLLKDYYIDGQNTRLIFFEKISTGRKKKVPQITTRGWVFWTMIFYNSKKFTSRSILWGVKLYFEFTRNWSLSCSNTVILWQLTWNYRFWLLLTTISGQDSEFAKFWPRSLTM